MGVCYSFDKVKCLAQCKALFGKENSRRAQFFGAGSLTAARVRHGAQRGSVRGSFARFGVEMAASARLQNDAGGRQLTIDAAF